MLIYHASMTSYFRVLTTKRKDNTKNLLSRYYSNTVTQSSSSHVQTYRIDIVKCLDEMFSG